MNVNCAILVLRNESNRWRLYFKTSLARRKFNACANEWISQNILQNTDGSLTPLRNVAFDWLVSRFAQLAAQA